MLNKDKTKLLIFDDEDRNYKFESFEEETNQHNMFNGNLTIDSGQFFISGNGEVKRNKSKLKTNLINKILSFKFELLVNPIKLFKQLKENKIELNEEKLKFELTKLNEIMEDIKTIKQTALMEQLEKENLRLKKELILSKFNYTYLEEDDIIKFCNGETKAIKLDWIKNFCRVIPKQNISKINEAMDIFFDDRRIFDNIVILHYDPEQNGTQLTEKEKEKKRDPIAFGAMKCSNRLYYITDWEDKYCDLTLKKVLDKLGIEEAHKINIKKEINDLKK